MVGLLGSLLDSEDEDALKAQGVDRVDVAVIGIGEDSFRSGVLTTILLKKMGVLFFILLVAVLKSLIVYLAETPLEAKAAGCTATGVWHLWSTAALAVIRLYVAVGCVLLIIHH